MLKLLRLNHDSAWFIEKDGFGLLLDPWLSASQTDGVAWFSRQWHVRPWIHREDLPKTDGVLVSHPFTDHCDRETLLKLPPELPFWGPKGVIRKVGKWNHFKEISRVPSTASTTIGPWEVSWLPPPGLLDPVHGALYFKGETQSILYAPHGYPSNSSALNSLRADLLITTPIRYQLPFFLGGTINLGPLDAVRLANRVGAKVFIPTHHEQKRGEGIVARLAQTDFDWQKKILAKLPESSKLVEPQVGVFWESEPFPV